ncbi:MAG: helix-turn-helix domain-containing protein [Spirochaetales bacterium]|nr:helix-turn-helix domain-containing protein [Spirochaetales bacterium]
MARSWGDQGAFPPGKTIRDLIEDRGMTQKEFATRMGLSEKHVSKLIAGEVLLTTDVVLRLIPVIGKDVLFWSNLEALYRADVVRETLKDRIALDARILPRIPLEELSTLGWIALAEGPEAQVELVRRYFEVCTLQIIESEAMAPYVSFGSHIDRKMDYTLLAWIQQAKFRARGMGVRPLDHRKLERSMATARSLSLLPPKEFLPELRTLLGHAGVAFVVLPSLKELDLEALTFFAEGRATIAFTAEGKDSETFWAILFREAAHILLRHVGPRMTSSNDAVAEAERLGEELLLPFDRRKVFFAHRRFDEEAVLDFAKEERIHPSIVAGRLPVLKKELARLTVGYDLSERDGEAP